MVICTWARQLGVSTAELSDYVARIQQQNRLAIEQTELESVGECPGSAFPVDVPAHYFQEAYPQPFINNPPEQSPAIENGQAVSFTDLREENVEGNQLEEDSGIDERQRQEIALALIELMNSIVAPHGSEERVNKADTANIGEVTGSDSKHDGREAEEPQPALGSPMEESTHGSDNEQIDNVEQTVVPQVDNPDTMNEGSSLVTAEQTVRQTFLKWASMTDLFLVSGWTTTPRNCLLPCPYGCQHEGSHSWGVVILPNNR